MIEKQFDSWATLKITPETISVLGAAGECLVCIGGKFWEAVSGRASLSQLTWENITKFQRLSWVFLWQNRTSEFLHFWEHPKSFHEFNFESSLGKQQIYSSGTFGVAQYFGEPQYCYQHSNQALVKGALFSLRRTFRWLVGRQLSALLVSARSLGGHQLLYAPGF